MIDDCLGEISFSTSVSEIIIFTHHVLFNTIRLAFQMSLCYSLKQGGQLRLPFTLCICRRPIVKVKAKVFILSPSTFVAAPKDGTSSYATYIAHRIIFN